MSDLYRLAVALREAPEQAITRLINERALSMGEFKDFFDLSQALLTPKSQLLMQAAITTSQLRSLRSLLAEEKLTKEQAASLLGDFLAFQNDEGSLVIANWLKEKIKELPSTGTIALVEDKSYFDSIESVDRDCGIHAFEAIQAVTELIFDFDQNLVREVARGSLGLPDVKRLASHLGKDKDYVKLIFELGKSIGLFVASNSKIRASSEATRWLEESQINRWIELAKGWVNIAGSSGVRELQLQIPLHGENLRNLISFSFPMATLAQGSRVNQLYDLAELIGLSAAGSPASWLDDSLSQNWQKVSKQLFQRLPKEQDRVIIQGDLSLVAPGPLPAKVEVELRKFAVTESIGLAPSYRLSASSISTGLEEGLTESKIRKLLEKLGGAIPQPVDYLISEVSNRFGRIKISKTEIGSKLFVNDDLLAKQLTMDSKLQSLGIRRESGDLYSSIDSEAIYFTLRENGYLAVRVSSSGEIIAPSAMDGDTYQLDDAKSQLLRLRQQQLNQEIAPESNETERKISLAIKSKSTIAVDIKANGKVMSFLLEPIGIANGRLRAKDRKADIERTLPVSAITAIRIG